MAIVGQLMVLITGNHAPLMASLAASQAGMTGFTTTAASSLVGLRTALIGLGAGAVVGMGLAVNAAREFQEQMAIINTIAHLLPDELTEIGEGIRALSVSSGTGLGDLTQAYYDLLSAGVPVTEALGILTQANTLAIGGLATTAQTVDLLTTAINAYGLDVAGATLATDMFALAIQNGKVTAAEIAATFADIAPLANSAGIGIDEIAAAYALLTARGVPAADAMTQMNRAILELIKPGADLIALQEKLGINFAELAAEKGLVVALEELRVAAAANGVPFQDLFGRLEGLKFALATTGTFFGDYTTQLAGMGTATGTALLQFEERMGTLDRALMILGASFNDLGIALGTGLLPPLTSFVQGLSQIIQGVTAWATANPQVAGTILPVVAAIGALAIGVTLLNVAIGLTALLLSPVGIALAIIGGIAILVATNFDALQRGVQVVIDTLLRMIELARIGAEALHDLPGTVVDTARGGNIGRDPIGDFLFGTWGGKPPPTSGTGGTFNTPGFHAGEVGSPFAGPPTPVQVNSTTNVILDGEKVGSVTDRRLYNNASQASSGFNRGALEY